MLKKIIFTALSLVFLNHSAIAFESKDVEGTYNYTEDGYTGSLNIVANQDSTLTVGITTVNTTGGMCEIDKKSCKIVDGDLIICELDSHFFKDEKDALPLILRIVNTSLVKVLKGDHMSYCGTGTYYIGTYKR